MIEGGAAGGRNIRPLLQVDRVASVEEATLFRNVGADLIGVALEPDPRFDDRRYVTDEVAAAIRDAARPAYFVGILPNLDDDPAAKRERLARLLALRPDYLQLTRAGVGEGLSAFVQQVGVPVIVDGLEIDDDDGGFIDSDDPADLVDYQLTWTEDCDPVLAHLDVATRTYDPWSFLTETAPLFPDECLQLADVAAILTAIPMPLMLNLALLKADTVADYARAFPQARGFFGRLGPRRASKTAEEPDALLTVMAALAQAWAITPPRPV